MSIQVNKLSFHYPDGSETLKAIDLAIEQGEQVALMGSNGAGKTTLIKHLNGLLRPTQGWVRINGRDTRQCQPEDLVNWVGLVFQNPNNQLFAATVAREIAFGPKNMGISAKSVDRMTREAMHRTGIASFARRNPYDLSPSERKRVALAAVLAMSPQVYLLDEPTQGQDHFGQEIVRRVIAHLKLANKSVIAITHDVDFALANFERAVIMCQGRIVADGPMSAIATEMGISHRSLARPQMIAIGRKLGFKTTLLCPKMLVDHLLRRRKESYASL